MSDSFKLLLTRAGRYKVSINKKIRKKYIVYTAVSEFICIKEQFEVSLYLKSEKEMDAVKYKL